ncbi:glycosyltransferase family 1 protein [Candidatus Parcubacteria bacterium]|nr:MAG: glycosyltransferase family 1 protein [Candidatus Parcubacteria bacterium]
MQRKQKILFVITKSVWGGAGRYVYDLATRLDDAGPFDIAVACGGNGPLLEKLRERGIRTIPLPWLERDIGIVRELAALGALVALFFRERPDVVHLNSSKVGGLGAVAAAIARLGRLSTRPRAIFTVHGWAFYEPRPRWQRWIIMTASWATGLLCDRVILINTADHRSAARFISHKKLALVFHGIKPLAALPRDEARRALAVRTGWPFAIDTVLIGAIAELTRTKGLDILLEAAEALKNRAGRESWRIVIIGEGEDRAKLAARIAERGLTNAVALAGFIPDAATLLSAFDIFVLPSRKEGLPYALMEAMSVGVAAVGSRVGGVPDLIEDNVSGKLVPAGDTTALAEAIGELIEHPGRRRMIGESARQRIRSAFPIDTMVHQTAALYLNA